jgi:hypothetical protein
VVRSQRRADGPQVRIAAKEIREQGHDGEARRSHQRQPTPHPSHGRGQDAVRAEDVRGGFDTRRRVDVRDDAFEIVEIAREPTGEAIRQQTERFVGGGTVVPSDPHPRGRRAGIGAMAREPAAAPRMPRTVREACLLPRAFGKIGLAGQRAWIAQLHRPGGARLPPWRPYSPFPVTLRRMAGKVLTTIGAWASCHGECACPDDAGAKASRGARRHPHPCSGCSSDRHRAPAGSPTTEHINRCLTLGPGIRIFLTERIREDRSEGS